VDRVWACFQCSPQKSTHRASCELQLPQHPPHFHMAVRNHLNAYLSQRQIGCAGASDVVWCRRPPRSPDLIPCDFFLWGNIKDEVFVPPLPQSLQELRQRITTAIASITRDTLHKVWGWIGVGLSSRHLPCDSWGTCRFAVRCVQNFESFSIDWCRCEVPRMSHLFSVLF
jgi:hypothetical protein